MNTNKWEALLDVLMLSVRNSHSHHFSLAAHFFYFYFYMFFFCACVISSQKSLSSFNDDDNDDYDYDDSVYIWTWAVTMVSLLFHFHHHLPFEQKRQVGNIYYYVFCTVYSSSSSGFFCCYSIIFTVQCSAVRLMCPTHQRTQKLFVEMRENCISHDTHGLYFYVHCVHSLVFVSAFT